MVLKSYTGWAAGIAIPIGAHLYYNSYAWAGFRNAGR